MDFTQAPLKITEQGGRKKKIQSGTRLLSRESAAASRPLHPSNPPTLSNVLLPRRRDASLTSPSLFCITCSEESARRREKTGPRALPSCSILHGCRLLLLLNLLVEEVLI